MSHLYPTKEMEKEFNLVIVDTPGCNSSETSDANKKSEDVNKQEVLDNEHMKIALQAISSGEKEMVVICTNTANDFPTDLGDFLHAIYQSMEEDAGNFNDRFIFAQNCCDATIYSGGDSLEGRKNGFATKLMKPEKYGFKNNESAPNFIPRVMMLSAGVKSAIQKGAANFSVADIKASTEKKDMRQRYRNFSENIVEFPDKNYYLMQVCDIPEYRKVELQKRFDDAMQVGNTEEAVSIQTGMECLEIAIKDYIERYAYPFKIRALRKSFRPLLEAVAAQVKTESDLLEKYRADLEGKKSEQRIDEQRKEEQEEVERALRLLEEKINKQKEKISNISFDKSQFQNISYEMVQDITPLRNTLRKDNDEGKAYTKDEMMKKMEEVQVVFYSAFQKASSKYKEVEKGYQLQLEEICNNLRSVYDEMQTDENYNFVGYNFEKSLGVQKVKELDIDALRKEVENTKENKTVIKKNAVKDEVYKWWQFGKKISQYFAPETISVNENFYSMKPVMNCLINTAAEFETLCKETTKKYEDDINGMKNMAINMAEAIPADINATIDKIKHFKKSLIECGENICELNKLEILVRDKKEFLEGMIATIEIGGSRSV